MSPRRSIAAVAYSALAGGVTQGAILHSGNVNLAINTSQSVTIDLDQNGSGDFRLSFYDGKQNKPFLNNDPNNSGAFVLSQADDTGLPVTPLGATIDGSYLSAQNEGWLSYGYTGNAGAGDWPNLEVTEGYVGVKLVNGGNATYGWLHLIYNGLRDDVTLVDYALETTPGKAIAAGSTVVPAGPHIYKQPQAQTNYLGANIRFEVVALGNPALSYQWKTGTSGSYTNLTNGPGVAGANGPTLTLSNVTEAGTADYLVTLSNTLGTLNSSAAHLTVAPVPSSYAAGVAALHPASYWQLNESSGTTAYDFAGGHHGTHVGGVTFTVGATNAGFGSAHGAAQYNGTTAYTLVPSTIAGSDFTISFWVQTSATGGTANWFNGRGLVDGYISSSAKDFGVALVGGKAAFGVGNPDTTLTSLKSINDGVWHHVVATWNSGGSMKIYVDGALDGTGLGGAGPRGYPVNLRIGSIQAGTAGGFLNGRISDVALFNETLTAGQIANLHQSAASAITFETQPLSQTITAGETVQLTGAALGASPLSYQWQAGAIGSGIYSNLVDGGNLSGVNSPTLTLSGVLSAQTGDYVLLASNSSATATSSAATLMVNPDVTAPTLIEWWNVGPTNLVLAFSEKLSPGTATNTANYVFTNGLAITRASLDPEGGIVTLTTAPMSHDTTYTLLLSGLQDQAQPPNIIAANTTITFTPSAYQNHDIGMLLAPSRIQLLVNGSAVSTASQGVGGAEDQFHFQYQQQNGDFDVCVRVAGLSLSDIWAQAGLMARETLGMNSRFAASLTTPAMNGCFFEWRDLVGGEAARTGAFPANYPDTWLRLQRTGNTFTGYASYDGQTWSPLGSQTLMLSNQLYLGLVAASHTGSQATEAVFYDASEVTTNNMVGDVFNPNEPPGPSSRKTPLAITEIMYKPAPRTDGQNLEFIELHNSNPWFHDISKHRLKGESLDYTFPAGTIIPGGGYVLVAAAPADMQEVYGTATVLGPYDGSLKTSDTVELYDEQGALLLSVPYSSDPPWPVAADGAGHSLVLANPTYGEADPRAWSASSVAGGSPGQMEAFRPGPLHAVVVNEFLAHTDPPDYDYIELYNHANSPVDISGCTLSDDPGTNKFVIPPGTTIPARGFVFFSETNMNFALDAVGETIYFRSPDQSQMLDAVRFVSQENGVATGRWPDGGDPFYRLTAKTPGAANAPIRISDIVINELMYHPISGDDDDQYVELYNSGAAPVNLGGWTLDNGIGYTFTSNTIIAPNSFLVVARNAAQLMTHYPHLNTANCLGNFGGRLSHSGERIALTMPDTVVSTNSSAIVVTNLIHITVDEVTYSDGGKWGRWSDGSGSSLELISPHSNHRLPSNWADSDETAKSVWTNIEVTGVLDNGDGGSIGYAQMGLLDAGECLIDDVEVRSGTSGANLVLNPGFESDLSNWVLFGNHSRSSRQASGYSGGQSLQMRASGRMWTGDNSCEMKLAANSLTGGQTATLRFKARWLRGWPEVLMRLNGNWLEATGSMAVPQNLGTPGLPNSCAAVNVGPAIYNVSHSPALPSANEPAVVTACLHDPDGVQNTTLHYRIDPATSYVAATLKDDGTGGDAVAGDGVFSATIPGQPANTIAAFYVTAGDSVGAATRFPSILDDNAPVRECLVMFGDGNAGGSFGVYHLWISQSNSARWTALGDLSNEGIDATFVNGHRIIYNMKGRWTGSPFHQSWDTPDGNLCHYSWAMPEDDEFLGTTVFTKIHQPGNAPNDDPSMQREHLANSFLRALGVPWLNKRYIAVYVNGNRRGYLMEDTQVPGGDLVNQFFPDDTGGWTYKMQPWFEFGHALDSNGVLGWNFPISSWCNLMPYTTTGGAKKLARYRWMFLTRRPQLSANDYAHVFSLVDAADSFGTPNYAANMENIADMENWMRVFAANHAAGNSDSFGSSAAQNLYGYIGEHRVKYSLMMWDFNIGLGNNGGWQPGQNLFTGNDQDPNVTNIWSEPVFRRMYWRALKELVNGPLDPANSGALLDARYQVFTANGFAVEDPNTHLKGWIDEAKNAIAAQMFVEEPASFSVNPSVALSNNVARLSGTAPFDVKTVLLNGVEYPLEWNSVGGWTLAVPLVHGTNTFDVSGVDMDGNPIAGDTNAVWVVYGGADVAPAGQVVINEIMFNPAQPNAEFVELHNVSTQHAFDLSGWQFNGLSYTFPAGAMIQPQQFLVLAANGPAFAAAYGVTTPVFDVFDGQLQNGGETLTLSCVSSGTNLVVAKVRYDDAAPWPTNTSGTGRSLQLIDPHEDNWRPGNWAAGGPGQLRWIYTNVTGTASSSTLYVYLQSAGDLYLDDIHFVAGGVPDAGTNLLPDGDFESGFPGPWTVSANLANSTLSTEIKHSGNASLHLISTSAGTSQGSSIWRTFSPTLASGAAYSLSFWYRQSTNGGPLTIRLSGNGVRADVAPAPIGNLSAAATPGAANSVVDDLPAFPPLWLNEVQAENQTGITNSAGQRTAWVELFNPGTNVVSLAGLCLANNYGNLAAWTFPAGTVIHPGEFKIVFTDGQTLQSTTNEPHTSFVLPASAGSLALSRIYNGEPQVLDYVNYTNLPANRSHGSFPDGQSFDRQEFFYVTPRGTNNGTSAPLMVSINEWMADNTHTRMNPVGNAYDDWFELYNFSSNTVSLAGYFLTDDLAAPTKSEIPYGCTIPPHGFLLVWADNKSMLTNGELHVNFALSKNGEAIGLFGADGVPVDYVSFGAQASDVSPGRYPDGGPLIYPLPTPTPGTNNAYDNSPPQVTAISDRVLTLGQTLAFVATATDVDAPPQQIGFSLGAGAPAGATINPAGQFQWTPSAPGSNMPITLMVTDNGTPALAGTQSFRVTVVPPPTLAWTWASGDPLVLSWPTVAGTPYQVEYKFDLNQLDWTPLNNPMLGNGSPIWITNSMPGSQGYYRLRVLPQ